MEKVKIVMPICLIVVFCSLAYGIYQLLFLFRFHEMMKRAWEESVRVLDVKRQTRKKLEKKTSALYGEMEKKTFMAKIDSHLSYSGLGTRFPKLTAENFTAVLALIISLEWLVLSLILRNMGQGLITAVLTGFLVFEGLHFLRAMRYRRISSELLRLIDTLEMQALTCKDVIQMLCFSAEKVKEPLRSELFFTVIDARHCGNSSKAIRRLCNRVEHRYAKDLFLNLDICSRGKANYREVIRTAKKIVMQDLANSAKLKMLYRNAFFFTVALSGIGFVCMNVMLQMTVGQGNLWSLWQDGGIGKACLVYLGAVSLGGAWHFAKKMLG